MSPLASCLLPQSLALCLAPRSQPPPLLSCLLLLTWPLMPPPELGSAVQS